MSHVKPILLAAFMPFLVFIIAGCATNGSYFTGSYMDTQQQEFETDLTYEMNQHEIEIERMPDGAMKLHLDSGMLFDTDSIVIKPTFRRSLNKLARIIHKYDRTMVDVIGYADSNGTRDYNQQLSEDRAKAIVNYFSDYGISQRRMRTEGRGESEPRATNSTASGRRINRRVEIYISFLAE